MRIPKKSDFLGHSLTSMSNFCVYEGLPKPFKGPSPSSLIFLLTFISNRNTSSGFMNKLFTQALSIIGIISIAAIAASCGGGKTSSQAENSAAFDSVKTPRYSGYTAVAVTHSVKDYHSWLKVYTDISDPDSRLSVFASPDDPNLITVFELTKSYSDAKNSFSSETFKKELLEEGVTSEPVYNFYDIKYRASGKTDKVYRLGVSHAVGDYEKWKKEFDADEPIRAEAGLELRAISTNADDPLMINVMFATDNIDKAKNLINSEELRKRMAEGGVRSEPVFTVLRVPVE